MKELTIFYAPVRVSLGKNTARKRLVGDSRFLCVASAQYVTYDHQ